MQNTDLKSVRVSAGILIKNNKILLTQRLKTQPYPYFWEFPGGKKKDRESYFSCLKRELHEEIGINVKDAKLLCLSSLINGLCIYTTSSLY